MKKMPFVTALLILCIVSKAQNICQTIGNDSASLYNNGYTIGPHNINCGQNIHTESKWINVRGVDSLFFYTFQHRTFDYSRIYDANNRLIWFWNGEDVNEITWYLKKHSLFIQGNDSVRIEFHQGFDDPFCNGYLQIVGIACANANNSNNGNVGIGTTEPKRKLHIVDTMKLEPRNTEPSNPTKGDIYFDGLINKLRVYDGTVWQNCW